MQAKLYFALHYFGSDQELLTCFSCRGW
jgi:hypothetical protein